MEESVRRRFSQQGAHSCKSCLSWSRKGFSGIEQIFKTDENKHHEHSGPDHLSLKAMEKGAFAYPFSSVFLKGLAFLLFFVVYYDRMFTKDKLWQKPKGLKR